MLGLLVLPAYGLDLGPRAVVKRVEGKYQGMVEEGRWLPGKLILSHSESQREEGEWERQWIVVGEVSPKVPHGSVDHIPLECDEHTDMES